MTEPLILGVSRAHDVGAALIRGSDLLVLAEAERVLDDKHAQGPEKLPPAILAALKEIGATPADINAIVVPDTGLEGLEHQRLTVLVRDPYRERLAAPLTTTGQPGCKCWPIGIATPCCGTS